MAFQLYSSGFTCTLSASLTHCVSWNQNAFNVIAGSPFGFENIAASWFDCAIYALIFTLVWCA